MKSPTAQKKKKEPKPVPLPDGFVEQFTKRLRQAYEWRDGWCYDTEGRVIRGVGLGSIAERKKNGV
jgi:hypothetical protein